MKKLSVILFLILGSEIFSQETISNELLKKKSFSISLGTNASYSYDSRIPGIAITPNVILNYKRFQFQAGPDIYLVTYPRKIIGPHAAVKYLFFDENKKLNLFADLNFQFVKFGMGGGLDVPYNYLPQDDYWYNLVQVKSYINTIGLGFSATFLKRFSIIAVFGGGYNYYTAKFSPININHEYIAYLEMGNVTKPILYGRLGLSFKILKAK